MINAYLFSLNSDADISKQWDYGFLKDFLEGKMWRTYNWQGFDIKKVDKIPNGGSAIVVIPARHHKGLEKKVDEQLHNLNRVVVFLMGDEEADFDVELIKHPNRHIWVQNPHRDKHDEYNRLGTGYPQHIDIKYADKDKDIFFAGQVTHKRRVELTDILLDMNDSKVHVLRTRGFTQGDKPEVYYYNMARAKIAPAPSGAVIPDSFRLFEALEAMAIPVADQKCPNDEIIHDYWDWLFQEDTPFPKVVSWDRLFGLREELLAEWPHNMHKITAWWIEYKRNFAYKVMGQLDE
jgi:hypothetical protein